KELRRWKVPVRYSREFVGGKEVSRHPWPATPPVFSANGKVVFAAAEKTLHRWDVDTGKELPPVTHGVKTLYPRCFATADAGRVLMLAPDLPTSSVALVDLDAGETVRQFSAGHSMPITIGVSPDGRTIAFQDGKDIRLLEVETGQERAKLTGGTDIVLASTFSPNGRLLAVSGIRDSAIRVWRLPSREPVPQLDGVGRDYLLR